MLINVYSIIKKESAPAQDDRGNKDGTGKRKRDHKVQPEVSDEFVHHYFCITIMS